jgi:phosphoenolpyruvate-protein kinase (PTS system EI component)
MVGCMEDIRKAKDIVKEGLAREGISVAENIKFGIMIKIPAIALIADQAVKSLICSVRLDELKWFTDHCCELSCAGEVQNYCKEHLCIEV